MADNEDFELERLRAEIAQEMQMKEMLEHSMKELQITVDELEKRMDTIDDENNEWKTRFETQQEMNQQLQKQAFLFQDKVDDARKTFKESRQTKNNKTGQGNVPIHELNEVTPYHVKQLQRDKDSLLNQLRDMEWKLDQESKAYHKANEERKHCLVEINSTKDAINNMKQKQKLLVASQSESLNLGPSPRPTGNSNLRQDQRILDPKKGPIKKTAAVKNLPRIQDG